MEKKNKLGKKFLIKLLSHLFFNLFPSIFLISSTFSQFFRITFHLSFTLLVYYRFQILYLVLLVLYPIKIYARFPTYTTLKFKKFRKKTGAFLQDYHFLRCSFPENLKRLFFLNLKSLIYNEFLHRRRKSFKFGLFSFLSPILTKSLLFSFPPLNEML